MNEVKIVIGANYGDEGKGLMTRHFCLDAKDKDMRPIVIFHNGTAQRGHTVDYNMTRRHVYHHFGSGTGDRVPTYFADTFLLHPMTFSREFYSITNGGILFKKVFPQIYCSPNCSIITPFDMAVDLATNEYIAAINGEKEYASCCFGSWCATERMQFFNYTIQDYVSTPELYSASMEKIMQLCLAELVRRNVDLAKISTNRDIFNKASVVYKNTVDRFRNDLMFFKKYVKLCSYDEIWKLYDYHIFENGQGLGLDKDVDNDWHTTSKTGLFNPYNMIKDKNDYNAEACYVTRSYLTRHGVGPLEEAVQKEKINDSMVDKTNIFNENQGNLRYGYLESNDQKLRIENDYIIAANNPNFKKSISVTHCNEFSVDKNFGDYFSNNPFVVNPKE